MNISPFILIALAGVGSFTLSFALVERIPGLWIGMPLGTLLLMVSVAILAARLHKEIHGRLMGSKSLVADGEILGMISLALPLIYLTAWLGLLAGVENLWNPLRVVGVILFYPLVAAAIPAALISVGAGVLAIRRGGSDGKLGWAGLVLTGFLALLLVILWLNGPMVRLNE